MVKRLLQQIGKCADAFRAIGPSSVRRSFSTIAANIHLACLQLQSISKWKWPSSSTEVQALLVSEEKVQSRWWNGQVKTWRWCFFWKKQWREKNSYLKIHEVEWLYSVLLSALPFLNLAIFFTRWSRANWIAHRKKKQSSSFVDACRAGGRKYQGPRGHLGRDPIIKSHREWWRAKTVCCVAHHRDHHVRR